MEEYQAVAKWGHIDYDGTVLVEFRNSNGDPYVVMETSKKSIVIIPAEHVRRVR